MVLSVIQIIFNFIKFLLYNNNNIPRMLLNNIYANIVGHNYLYNIYLKTINPQGNPSWIYNFLKNTKF